MSTVTFPKSGHLPRMTNENSSPATGQTLEERALAFAASQTFRRTFQDGMAMVEETAAYLDGPGRQESKLLPRRAALTYAGESMRLTTRLMQVASWLLVQRAIHEGDMAVEEAAKEKYRLGAREVCTNRKPEAATLLPERLLALLERSEQLYERVDRLDQAIYRDGPAVHDGARAHLDRLQSAFGAAPSEDERP